VVEEVHMNRRTGLLWLPIALVLTAVAIGWAVRRDRGGGAHMREQPARADDVNIRAIFVCCDDHGYYSPGVYVCCGGGRSALDTVQRAAPFMRAEDPGSAAAGLCGFVFRDLRYQGDTGGTMTLEPPPQPGPDGAVDWKAYGGLADVILINVDTGTARCCLGTILGEEVRNLRLGGR
jgi:hypothetical protein